VNTQNLKHGNKETQFYGQYAVECAKKSAEARKRKGIERKLIKEQLIEKMKASDWDEVIQGVIERAKQSDKGFEVLRDTLGEKPTETVDLNGTPAVVILNGEADIKD
jgi:hypothetical protein